MTIPLHAEQTDIVEAYDILHELGLRIDVTKPTSIASLRSVIVRLSPRGGTRIRGGSTVKMTPRGGFTGSPAVLNSHPRYVVPNFFGQDAAAAVDWAGRHEMFWAIPALPAIHGSRWPHLFDAYSVIGQEPSAGQIIEQGHMVGGGFLPTPLTLTVVAK